MSQKTHQKLPKLSKQHHCDSNLCIDEHLITFILHIFTRRDGFFMLVLVQWSGFAKDVAMTNQRTISLI